MGMWNGGKDELVVGGDIGAEEGKVTGLGGCVRGDIAIQLLQRWSEFSPWRSKNPPAITIDLPVVLIALRLHAIGYPLIDGRKTIAYLHFLQRIEVDHHDTARARGEVAAVSIRADMLREARVVAEAEGVGFCRRNDEASAVQLDEIGRAHV